jgi:hypothetical protein
MTIVSGPAKRVSESPKFLKKLYTGEALFPVPQIPVRQLEGAGWQEGPTRNLPRGWVGVSPGIGMKWGGLYNRQPGEVVPPAPSRFLICLTVLLSLLRGRTVGDPLLDIGER